MELKIINLLEIGGASSSHKKNNYIDFIFLFLYFLLTLVCILRHEMWRDEYQAWMIASHSNSLSALFNNIKYEGHPALWHLILYFASKLTSNINIVKLIHVLIATASVCLILFFSPFRRYQKLLAIFGYFTFYEYSIVSRNYGLGFFLLLLFCVLYRNWIKNIFNISIVLFLLGNSNAFGLIIAASCLSLLAASIFMKHQSGFSRLLNLKIILALLFIAFGLIFSLYQILPPEDGGYLQYSMFLKDFDLSYLKLALSRLGHAYVPIPKLDIIDLWGTYLFPNSLLFGELIYFLFLFYFIQKKSIIGIFFVISNFALLIFFYSTKGFFEIRHEGHLYMVLFASYWMFLDEKNPNVDFFTSKFEINKIFNLILLLQLIAGIVIVKKDLVYNFSNSLDVANYINNNHLNNNLILGTSDAHVSSISGALGKEIYYPEKDGFGSFITWNIDRRQQVNTDKIIEQAKKLYHQKTESVVVILNKYLKNTSGMLAHEMDLGDGYYLHLIKKFNSSCLCRDEKYFLYIINKTPARISGKDGII